MAYSRPVFFNAIRGERFNGHMVQSQVDGMSAILDRAAPDMPIEELAYCFATAYHETARTMQPIEEYGRGQGHPYGIVDELTGKAYFGRGFVQLTWKKNYEKMGKYLLLDLVRNPELALDLKVAADIMVDGMTRGMFTGKKLADYFGPGKSDPVGARRIINGTDRATLIAGYHSSFLSCLKKAKGAAESAPPPPSAAQPPASPPARSGGLFSVLGAAFKALHAALSRKA